MDPGNLVIVSISKDRMALEFTQKVINFLYSHNGGKAYKEIPEVENLFSSGSFSGGEFDPKFRVDVSNKTVIVFGLPSIETKSEPTPGEIAFRVCATAEAAYSNGAKEVHAVLPDLHFSRADRLYSDYEKGSKPYENNKGRGRIALLQAKMFKAVGIKTIFTLEVHSSIVRQFYTDVYGRDDALEVLYPSPLISHYIAKKSTLNLENDGENIVLVSPDKGAKNRIIGLVNVLREVYGLKNVSKLYLDKIRKSPNNPDELEISLSKDEPFSKNFTTLKGKDVIIVDDLVDTAGTISSASKHIREQGVVINGETIIPNSVSAVLVHPVLAGPNFESAMKKLATANLKELIIFNTHPFVEDNLIFPLKKNTTIIRSAWIFSQAIYEFTNGRDIRSMYKTNGVIDKDKVEKLFNMKRSTSFNR